MEINLENTYWERIIGYPIDVDIDARWILHKEDSERTYGSLRIVSHPDLPPGQLRAYYTYVSTIEEKSDSEVMQTIEDYQMNIGELEVYSVDEKIETDSAEYVAPFKELEELFGVKIFE